MQNQLAIQGRQALEELLSDVNNLSAASCVDASIVDEVHCVAYSMLLLTCCGPLKPDHFASIV